MSSAATRWWAPLYADALVWRVVPSEDLADAITSERAEVEAGQLVAPEASVLLAVMSISERVQGFQADEIHPKRFGLVLRWTRLELRGGGVSNWCGWSSW